MLRIKPYSKLFPLFHMALNIYCLSPAKNYSSENRKTWLSVRLSKGSRTWRQCRRQSATQIRSLAVSRLWLAKYGNPYWLLCSLLAALPVRSYVQLISHRNIEYVCSIQGGATVSVVVPSFWCWHTCTSSCEWYIFVTSIHLQRIVLNILIQLSYRLLIFTICKCTDRFRSISYIPCS